ncbi:MAG: fluoride efflux transporter CrcB [Anaerolineales bacterium]
MWMQVLVVGLGGFVGANLRYALVLLMGTQAFPWATLSANLIGCFGLAAFATWSAAHSALGAEARLLVTTGFFGALTTFSTFSYETLILWLRADYGLAVGYLLASVVLGLGTAWAGHTLAARLLV